jgi:hypothetical protein
MNEKDIDIPADWRSYVSIQRWCDGLLHVTGLTPAELEDRLDALFRFCALHDCDPETMAEECRQGSDRLARRAFYLQMARDTPANLIVQSFLVHNGVNVFGDIVCMPRTREQIIAEQGEQWVRSD